MVLYLPPGSGYDNGTGSWVEQSNDVNVNNLHVAPPVSFDSSFLCVVAFIYHTVGHQILISP